MPTTSPTRWTCPLSNKVLEKRRFYNFAKGCSGAVRLVELAAPADGRRRKRLLADSGDDPVDGPQIGLLSFLRVQAAGAGGWRLAQRLRFDDGVVDRRV